MKKIILLTALFLNSSFAEKLTFKEAEEILSDSLNIALRTDSSDYSNPDTIIKVALNGLYGAYRSYETNQDDRKEKKQKPLSANYPLFQVAGESVPASSVVVDNDENSPIFKNIRKAKLNLSEEVAYMDFNVRLDKKAVELAAPYFTGHKIIKHYAPAVKGDFIGEDIYFDGNYYYILIEGLGDHMYSWEIEKVKPEGNSYLLTGTLTYEPEDKKFPFILKLSPSDEVKGTWKREWKKFY